MLSIQKEVSLHTSGWMFLFAANLHFLLKFINIWKLSTYNNNCYFADAQVSQSWTSGDFCTYYDVFKDKLMVELFREGAPLTRRHRTTSSRLRSVRLHVYKCYWLYALHSLQIEFWSSIFPPQQTTASHQWQFWCFWTAWSGTKWRTGGSPFNIQRHFFHIIAPRERFKNHPPPILLAITYSPKMY